MVSKGIKGMPIGYVQETGESVDEESHYDYQGF